MNVGFGRVVCRMTRETPAQKACGGADTERPMSLALAEPLDAVATRRGSARVGAMIAPLTVGRGRRITTLTLRIALMAAAFLRWFS